MNNFSKLSAKLDNIADNLQGKGLVAEASMIDEVSNTLDAYSKESFIPEDAETMSKKQRESIAEYVDDAIQTLYSSEVGNVALVSNLYRFWMNTKDKFTNSPMAPEEILKSQPVQNFKNWLNQGAGKLIPDKYFRNGKNMRGSTWDQIGTFLELLNETPSQAKKERKDFDEFVRQENINEKAPKNINPSLEELFKKEAGFHNVPKKYQESLGLIYALKRKGAPEGSYAQPKQRYL